MRTGALGLRLKTYRRVHCKQKRSFKIDIKEKIGIALKLHKTSKVLYVVHNFLAIPCHPRLLTSTQILLHDFGFYGKSNTGQVTIAFPFLHFYTVITFK